MKFKGTHMIQGCDTKDSYLDYINLLHLQNLDSRLLTYLISKEGTLNRTKFQKQIYFYWILTEWFTIMKP